MCRSLASEALSLGCRLPLSAGRAAIFARPRLLCEDHPAFSRLLCTSFLQYPQIFYSELQDCINLILMTIVFMFVCLPLKTKFLEGKIHVCVACAPRTDASFSSVNPNEYCRLDGQMTRSLRNLIFLLISSEIFRYNCTKRDFIDIKRWVVSCILPNKSLCW